MSGEILFTIQSGTGYALSIDANNRKPGGGLILWNIDPSNPDQLWTWVYHPTNQASILFNPKYNLCAAPTQLTNGAAVALFEPGPEIFSGANTWQIVPAKGAFAVRPPANTDLNLNALGNDNRPGTLIGIWEWHGGDGNEIWTSTFSAL